jgi:hypothetical protein
VKPGRQLDALVAEKVMGWKCDNVAHESTEVRWIGDKTEVQHSGWENKCEGFGSLCPAHLPYYSTDIAAAWDVVEKLSRDVCTVEIKSHRRTMGWTCFTRMPSDEGISPIRIQATTAPHAICLAALAAVGATPPKDTSSAEA